MGYTPLFDSLTKGTLCGKWPDIGLWPIVLSLADRYGVVDCTPIFIAGVTGLSVEDVTACMARFCEPDPHSRSDVRAGARLELLDEHRAWGWRIVNLERYREKARKAAYDAARTASGKDAARKEAERGVSREVPRSPAPTRSQTADADLNEAAEAAAADFLIPECPKDMNVLSERRGFSEWCAENKQSPTFTKWRRWVLRAKESGRYAKCKPRPPTEAEISAERARIIASQEATA